MNMSLGSVMQMTRKHGFIYFSGFEQKHGKPQEGIPRFCSIPRSRCRTRCQKRCGKKKTEQEVKVEEWIGCHPLEWAP
jgi:hypothetical protein